MEYTRLGRTGLTVSRLCVGTMNFGWQIDEQQSHAILDRAIEVGLTFVDTANMYGSETGDGLSERFIGSWFDKSGHRDHVVVATKVYAPMSERPNDGGLSARHIIASCEASLRRLGIGILPYSPLHFGALSGALRKQRDGIPGRAVLHAPERVEPHRAAIQRYEQLCADLGQEPTTVAIAWLLSRPEVTAPILGPRTPDQLDLPITALDNPLAEDARAALEEIFPPIGNGGPAPEAWAW
jgi:aryl-alcohol dehydrogenase-like predicted oxidoreductase